MNILADVPLPADVQVGPYLVEGVLGVGIDNIAYRAVNVSTGRRLALREYKPAGRLLRAPDGATLVARTAAETAAITGECAKIEAQFSGRERFVHPNVVAIFDCVLANGTVYLAMDWYDGKSLGTLLKETENLHRDELDEILPQLLDGLEALHDAGLLHGDISPFSMLIRRDGRLMLDRTSLRPAGIAADGRELIFQDFDAFCPEEYFFGDPAMTSASDIYSFGATILRLISGETPANAVHRARDLARSQEDPVAKQIASLKDRWPPDVLGVAEQALELVPDARPQSVAALREMLEERISAKQVANDASDGSVEFTSTQKPDLEDGEPETLRMLPRFSSRLKDADVMFAPPEEGKTPPRIAKNQVYRNGEANFTQRIAKPVRSDQTRTEAPERASPRLTLFPPSPQEGQGDWASFSLYLHEPGIDSLIRNHHEAWTAGRPMPDLPIFPDEARLTVLLGSSLTIRPRKNDFLINPKQIVIGWQELFHRVDFRIRETRAGKREAQSPKNIGIDIYAGPLLLGTIELDPGAQSGPRSGPLEEIQSNCATRLYLCHAPTDAWAEAAIDRAMRRLSLPFVGEVAILRAEKQWNRNRLKKIEAAELFLLYWSDAIAVDEHARQEWRFALELERSGFMHIFMPRNTTEPIPTELADAALHDIGA